MNPLQLTVGSGRDLFNYYAKNGTGEAKRVAQQALRKGSSRNWSRDDWINGGLLHIKRAREKGIPYEWMGGAHLGGYGNYRGTKAVDHFGSTPAGHNKKYLKYYNNYRSGSTYTAPKSTPKTTPRARTPVITAGASPRRSFRSYYA